MSNYVTTNIRLPEEDYLKLKEEAARKRKSLAAVIREKIGRKKSKEKSPEEILQQIRKYAEENAPYMKGVDIVQVLREMRQRGKW